MMQPLSFTKMTAYGNDYIYVTDLENNLINRCEVSRILSERNFSIGSDGLMCIIPTAQKRKCAETDSEV